MDTLTNGTRLTQLQRKLTFFFAMRRNILVSSARTTNLVCAYLCLLNPLVPANTSKPILSLRNATSE